MERIKEQLSKTKNTPYEFVTIDVILDDGLYIPSISSLNELRRDALLQLENTLIEQYSKNIVIEPDNLIINSNPEDSTIPFISVLFNTLLLDINYTNLKNIDTVYIPLIYFSDSNFSSLLKDICNKYKTYIYMPIIFKTEQIGRASCRERV